MTARLRVVPLTFPTANDCVSLWHRHHAPLPGGFAWYCLGVVADGALVGASICGRPTNRNNDDRHTVELLRLATSGADNACSALLGASARVAREMGASRIVTYTLGVESGASLRGAGWSQTKSGITSWWTTPTKGRHAAVDRPHMQESKVRWEVKFREPTSYALPTQPQEAAAFTQHMLDLGGVS